MRFQYSRKLAGCHRKATDGRASQALLSAVPVPDPTLRGKREQIVLVGDVPSPANPPSGCRFHTRCWKAQDKCAVEEPLLQMRPDGRGEHESACHFAEPLDVVHAEPEEAQHHYAEREDDSENLGPRPSMRDDSLIPEPYDRKGFEPGTGGPHGGV